MERALKNWIRVKAVLHDFFRRHWRRALIVRDWFRWSEETVHLLLAGVVGVLGGLANWLYYLCNQLVQLLLMGRTRSEERRVGKEWRTRREKHDTQTNST